MTYTCFKGWHWFLPVLPRFFYRKKTFLWTSELSENCVYVMDKNAMKSWHKLVGVSNHMNPRKESIRFVWKWDLELQKFRIAVFIERNYEFRKTVTELDLVSSNEPINMKLHFDGENVFVTVNKNEIKLPYKISNFGFRLNPYFGGQKTAPHLMTLKLK